MASLIQLIELGLFFPVIIEIKKEYTKFKQLVSETLTQCDNYSTSFPDTEKRITA